MQATELWVARLWFFQPKKTLQKKLNLDLTGFSGSLDTLQLYVPLLSSGGVLDSFKKEEYTEAVEKENGAQNI